MCQQQFSWHSSCGAVWGGMISIISRSISSSILGHQTQVCAFTFTAQMTGCSQCNSLNIFSKNTWRVTSQEHIRMQFCPQENFMPTGIVWFYILGASFRQPHHDPIKYLAEHRNQQCGKRTCQSLEEFNPSLPEIFLAMN